MVTEPLRLKGASTTSGVAGPAHTRFPERFR